MDQDEIKDGISIVIPAKDEELGIENTLRGIQNALDGMIFEIIVVDDGSVDGTAEKAKELGCKVMKHVENLGYGAALKSGIKAAKYDTIVITDADGTYPIGAIPQLVKIFRQGFSMVVGARTGANYLESIVKAPLRRALKSLVEYSAGRKVPDVNSGLRVFSRSEILPFFSHLCNTFSFTTSLTLSYMMTGKCVAYHPIDYLSRAGKTKVRLFRDSLRTIQYIVEAITFYNPLKIFLLLCCLMVFGAFLLFGLAIFSGLKVFYYLGIGSILMSSQIFAMGLLAVLLRQIMVKE